ncbi:MAG: YidC/Oxa1 family membrane protein insertase [Peptococcaceae bacterium]|nr:YidC/Oxa1 family membrane protein insertase [Peptococcaceae bacterium]
MLQPLVDGITWVINWLYGLTAAAHVANYGLAIILFTILLKIALYPLTLKQMKSMYMMQQLGPKIKEIQEKYRRKDPQKMQQKIMDLYREHNVNPMSGCLPLLIQMPILLALFQALRNFVYADVRHAGFLWIENLSQINNEFYILAILAGLSTFAQTRLTTNMADQTQKIMLYTMPLMIAYFATQVPAGLALYWVTFNILGIVQQYFVNKQTMALKEAIAEGAGNRKNG